MQSEFGMIGIGVMGRNLVLNLLDSGFKIAAFDVNKQQLDLLEQEATSSASLELFSTLESFTENLSQPRKIMLMVKAGEITDSVIADLLPYLDSDDIIIDGGNSNFNHTQNRIEMLKQHGMKLVGAGISGGARGARFGPSIMPGGEVTAWNEIKTYLQKIAAKTSDGQPCCQWIGPGGSGHFVKTIHNGIEYSDMELIAESFQILKTGNVPYPTISKIFTVWDQDKLNSYLMEISAIILGVVDSNSSEPIIDIIVDSAGQKGTGKWSAHSALDLGSPATLISAAVFQRFVSSYRDLRSDTADIYGSAVPVELPHGFIDQLENALYLARFLSYDQGFSLIQKAATTYQWQLDLASIAHIWTNGCIIRSKLLDDIRASYQNEAHLQSLLLSDVFSHKIQKYQQDLREVVSFCAQQGIPIPGFMAALSYFDSMRSERLPANLIQAQRDYFGSHGYHRMDSKSDQIFHTQWP